MTEWIGRDALPLIPLPAGQAIVTRESPAFTTQPPPGDLLGDLQRAFAALEAADGAYERGLRSLAEAGATPVEIVTVAVDDQVRRFMALAREGSPAGRMGATASDLARAAVHALQVAGHLPAQPRPDADWSMVHDGLPTDAGDS